LKAEWRSKINIVLSALDAAQLPGDMAMPGFGFHALTGDRAGTFAILVSRNWRLTLTWRGTDATDVDLEDYHGN
jgi:proteic killer suppression protein